jgi:hypothetical protein
MSLPCGAYIESNLEYDEYPIWVAPINNERWVIWNFRDADGKFGRRTREDKFVKIFWDDSPDRYVYIGY